MTEEKTYSSFEIMRALDIQKEKFRDWVNSGFVRASIPSPGRGQAARYTLEDIYSLALFIELLTHGFPRAMAATWVNRFRDSTRQVPYEDRQNDLELKIKHTDIPYKPLEPRKEPVYKSANFILFRRFSMGDTDVSFNVIWIIKDDWKVSLRSGSLWKQDDLLNQRKDEPFPWKSTLLINYRIIREAVDEALSKL